MRESDSRLKPTYPKVRYLRDWHKPQAEADAADDASLAHVLSAVQMINPLLRNTEMELVLQAEADTSSRQVQLVYLHSRAKVRNIPYAELLQIAHTLGRLQQLPNWQDVQR